MQVYERFFIDGSWVLTAGSGSSDVVNAATEDVMGRVPKRTRADVDAAAAAAFDEWWRSSSEELKKCLSQISSTATSLPAARSGCRTIPSSSPQSSRQASPCDRPRPAG